MKSSPPPFDELLIREGSKEAGETRRSCPSRVRSERGRLPLRILPPREAGMNLVRLTQNPDPGSAFIGLPFRAEPGAATWAATWAVTWADTRADPWADP